MIFGGPIVWFSLILQSKFGETKSTNWVIDNVQFDTNDGLFARHWSRTHTVIPNSYIYRKVDPNIIQWLYKAKILFLNLSFISELKNVNLLMNENDKAF